MRKVGCERAGSGSAESMENACVCERGREGPGEHTGAEGRVAGRLPLSASGDKMVARQRGALLPFRAWPHMGSGVETASSCLVSLSWPILVSGSIGMG